MPAQSTVTISLNALSCSAESQTGGSNPYLWPALVWIDKSPLIVAELGIHEGNAQNVLKRSMKAGDSITIESTVGVITRPFEEPLTNYILILTVGLFHANATPTHAVIAGYRSFQDTLRTQIEANLLDLNSSDPNVVDAARQRISTAVTQAVTQAIGDDLTAAEKLEVKLGTLTLDTSVGSASTSFTSLVNTDFTLTIGDPVGGRLLRYVDASQSGGGDVSSPQVIGQGGWQQFLFLFSGADNVIYAVNAQGQLLRYVDASQSGGGDVSSPQVIGQGGWQQFLFLFSGADNVIYAVNPQGQLLRYVDASQTGGGDVSSPQVIGQGGWQQFLFLFSGADNVIYAVNPQGQLLRYVDVSQSGGGDVSSPQVIGQGGWQQFLFLFSGADNVIYAVNPQGQLLRYVDASQTGGGDVSTPQVIGQGGWQQFLFLFSGAPGVIYAAEKALGPHDHYEIGASLTVVPVLCVDERAAVYQATLTLDSAKSTLKELEAEAEHATGQQKLELLAEVRQAKKDVAAAQQALDAANADLEACLNRNQSANIRPALT